MKRVLDGEVVDDLDWVDGIPVYYRNVYVETLKGVEVIIRKCGICNDTMWLHLVKGGKEKVFGDEHKSYCSAECESQAMVRYKNK